MTSTILTLAEVRLADAGVVQPTNHRKMAVGRKVQLLRSKEESHASARQSSGPCVLVFFLLVLAPIHLLAQTAPTFLCTNDNVGGPNTIRVLSVGLDVAPRSLRLRGHDRVGDIDVRSSYKCRPREIAIVRQLEIPQRDRPGRGLF
jgi:hypothetical protein